MAHQKFYPGKIPFATCATSQMVDNAPRGGDDYMRPIPKLQRLRHHVHATHYDSRPSIQYAAQHSKLLSYLECKFPRSDSAHLGDL